MGYATGIKVTIYQVGVSLLSVLLLAAITTTSCAAGLHTDPESTNSDHATSDHCNCAIEAELDNLVTAPPVTTVLHPDWHITLLPDHATQLISAQLLILNQHDPPPLITTLPPHHTWPVNLARVHL